MMPSPQRQLLLLLFAIIATRSVVYPLVLPSKSRACREWQDTGGIVCLRNFFAQDDFAAIQEEVHQVRRTAKAEPNSLARGRLAAPLPTSPRSAVAELLASPAVVDRISRAVGRALLPAEGDFPPEARFYGPGASMAWHRDDQAYVEPQVEAILTVQVEGGYDGETQWRHPNGRVCGDILEPNSITLIQAGGPEHQVTPVTRGHRSIVKAIFVSSFERSEEFGRLSRAAAVGSMKGSAAKRHGKKNSRQKR